MRNLRKRCPEARRLTVIAANFNLQPYAWALAVGLIIAAVKAGLVGGFFMHLIGEKHVIYWILALTFLLFIPLIALPLWTTLDTPYEPTTQGSVYEDHGEEGAERHDEGEEDHGEEAETH